MVVNINMLVRERVKVVLVRLVADCINLATVRVDMSGMEVVVLLLVAVVISIPVAERGTVEVPERRVIINTQLVIVRRIIYGTEVLAFVTVVSNMLVAVWARQVRELLVEESIRLVYVQVIMFRFVM